MADPSVLRLESKTRFYASWKLCLPVARKSWHVQQCRGTLCVPVAHAQDGGIIFNPLDAGKGLVKTSSRMVSAGTCSLFQKKKKKKRKFVEWGINFSSTEYWTRERQHEAALEKEGREKCSLMFAKSFFVTSICWLMKNRRRKDENWQDSEESCCLFRDRWSWKIENSFFFFFYINRSWSSE